MILTASRRCQKHEDELEIVKQTCEEQSRELVLVKKHGDEQDRVIAGLGSELTAATTHVRSLEGDVRDLHSKSEDLKVKVVGLSQTVLSQQDLVAYLSQRLEHQQAEMQRNVQSLVGQLHTLHAAVAARNRVIEVVKRRALGRDLAIDSAAVALGLYLSSWSLVTLPFSLLSWCGVKGRKFRVLVVCYRACVAVLISYYVRDFAVSIKYSMRGRVCG